MRVKCRINCTGAGYENFRVGEIRNLNKKLADKLILFRYAEPLTNKK